MRYIMNFDEFCGSRLMESKTAKEVFEEHKKDELVKVSAEDAYKTAVEMLGKEAVNNIYGTEEEFSRRYDEAQDSAKANGKYKRGEMPVINNSNFSGSGVGKEDEESAPRTEEVKNALESKDVDDKKVTNAVLSNQVVAFKFLVGNGFIDIEGKDKDIAKKTQHDLFNDDALAEEWLQAGGGPKEHKDVIKGDYEYIAVKDLKPIQEQIFVAKSLKMAKSKSGDKDGMDWLLNPDEDSPMTIVSSDNYILDGHHRWLGAYLVDENTKMRCVKIDMKCKDLLDLTNKFTGAIGNKPNVTA